MRELTIVEPERMSLLGLMLGGILRHNVARPELARRVSGLRGRLGVQGGKMRITLGFGDDGISITRGIEGPVDARVAGSLHSLLAVSLGRSALGLVLGRSISIRGNPFFALKVLPLFAAPGRRGGDR
jgi:ubiquinone biosynthesis protein UbiJ